MSKFKTEILFSHFGGSNALAVIDNSQIKHYQAFIDSGISADWDLFPKKLAELDGCLAGHQVNNLFVKYNSDNSIQELIIITDGYNSYAEPSEDLDFNNYESKAIKEMSIYSDYKKEILEELGKIEITSGKMAILCSFLDSSKGSIICDNGTYFLNAVKFVPIRKTIEFKDVMVLFECCSTQRKIDKEMIKNIDKGWSSIHCENCDKSFGGINSKVKWYESLYYKNQIIDKNKFSVEGLESFFEVSDLLHCEFISRKDGKSFGKNSSIGKFVGAYEESTFYHKS